MINQTRARYIGMLAIIVMAACSSSDVGGPGTPTPTVPTPGTTSTQVNLLTAATGAPAIANPVVQFYAVAGVDQEVFMYYKARASGRDSTVFLRFRVPKRALLARPNGTPFATGDSIQITITLLDPVHLEVGFEPSGLTFSPSDPARLKLSFLEADEDLNHDGKVDGNDATIQGLLAIWKRESASQPWMKLTTIVSTGTHEVEADVTGFTSYAIAW